MHSNAVMPALLTCFLLLLAFAACSNAEGPVYELEFDVRGTLANFNDQYITSRFVNITFSDEKNFEWESYDGWFNNAAHVEWGGYGE